MSVVPRSQWEVDDGAAGWLGWQATQCLDEGSFTASASSAAAAAVTEIRMGEARIGW